MRAIRLLLALLFFTFPAFAQTVQTSGPLGPVAIPGVILSAATNNSALIGSASGHRLLELTILNTTATGMDVRLYDVAAAPTCSSATGVVANYWAEANTISAGMTVNLGPSGKVFMKGIGICITGANANNDNSNAATGLNVNYEYQ